MRLFCLLVLCVFFVVVVLDCFFFFCFFLFFFVMCIQIIIHSDFLGLLFVFQVRDIHWKRERGKGGVCVGVGGGDRQLGSQTDRQTDRHTGSATDRRADRKTENGSTVRQRETQLQREM